jgi:hypothetical protein
MREHGCLIAAPGADLKNSMRSSEAKRVGHVGDDKRLRDRLTVADRQRTISIRNRPHGFWNEQVPWHFAHHIEDTGIGAALPTLFSDHCRAFPVYCSMSVSRRA